MAKLRGKLILAITLILLPICTMCFLWEVPLPFVPKAYKQLLQAARTGDLQTLDNLLKNGLIDVNAQYFEGLRFSAARVGTRNTALHEAARFGQGESILLLLAYGADPWLLNSKRRNAFLLLADALTGGDVLDGTPEGTRMRFAMAAMVFKGMNKDHLSEGDYLELGTYGIYSSNACILDRLKRIQEARLLRLENLKKAVRIGSPECVWWLGSQMADPKARTEAAALAINAYRKPAAIILIGLGVDVGVKVTEEGGTLLHLAAQKGNAPAVAGLLQQNALPDAKDNPGKTPADYASNPKIIEQLVH